MPGLYRLDPDDNGQWEPYNGDLPLSKWDWSIICKLRTWEATLSFPIWFIVSVLVAYFM